ncbi:MAG: polysaccharide biosynthesis/export family protein [Maricaulaceae bacterium]
MRRAFVAVLLSGASACVAGPQPTETFPTVSFEPWTEATPAYRFLPGDELDLVVFSAPELSRTLTVGPDGRIAAPLAGLILAADRTAEDVAADVRTALASELRSTDLEIAPRTFASQRIFVAGEVGTPGAFPLPGPIGVFEAVALAGGLEETARADQIAVLRRGPQGGLMLRVVDFEQAAREGGFSDDIPLRRGDIVFVPRSAIAEVNLFVEQYIRDSSPVELNTGLAIAPF